MLLGSMNPLKLAGLLLAFTSSAHAILFEYSGFISSVGDSSLHLSVGDPFTAKLAILDSFTPADTNPATDVGVYPVPAPTGQNPFPVVFNFVANGTQDFSFFPMFTQPIVFTNRVSGDQVLLGSEAGLFIGAIRFSDSRGSALSGDAFSMSAFEAIRWEQIEIAYSRPFTGTAFTARVAVPEGGPGVFGICVAIGVCAALRPKRS